MNLLARLIIAGYSRALAFYPHRFKNEFADEMLVVFRVSFEDTLNQGTLQTLSFCLKEFGGLPFHILREFWHDFERKETVMGTNEKAELASTKDARSSHREAFLSALPFALFGAVCMIGKSRVPWVGIYADLTFYFVVLLGLLIGLVKGIPRWVYSYLGWSLVYAWWWTNMYTRGFKLFGYTFGDESWGWRVWVPLLITVGIALLLTRSLRPLRELVLGIWQDWTLLSLAMYSLVGFMLLLYDEVHAPYTIAFMTASTLVICASVWIFMRSAHRVQRLISLLAGFFAGLLLDRIYNATWDFNAYNGLPARPAMPWYGTLLEMILIAVIWSPIVWLPVLVGLFKSTFHKETMT